MAIAFDAESDAQQASGATLTWQHTCAGSDRILVVVVGLRDRRDQDTVTGITYNGDALTFIDAQQAEGDSGAVEMWYLLDPDTGGAYDIVVTFDVGNDQQTGIGLSFTGVDSIGDFSKASGDSGTATVDVSSAADELVVDGKVDLTDTAPTVGAGQTALASIDHADTTLYTSASTEPGAATVTMSWTLNVITTWAIVGVALQPAAGDRTLEPNAVAAAAAVPSPTITLEAELEPNAAAAVSAVPNPTLTTEATLQPTPAVATAAVPSPTLTSTLTLEPTPVVATAAVPSPDTILEATLEPTPAIATAAVTSPALSGLATLEPTPAVATTAVPSPEITRDTFLYPDPVVAATAVPAPVLTTEGTLLPTPVVAASAVPAPVLDLMLTILLPTPAVAVSAVPRPTITLVIPAAYTPAYLLYCLCLWAIVAARDWPSAVAPSDYAAPEPYVAPSSGYREPVEVAVPSGYVRESGGTTLWDLG